MYKPITEEQRKAEYRKILAEAAKPLKPCKPLKPTRKAPWLWAVGMFKSDHE